MSSFNQCNAFFPSYISDSIFVFILYCYRYHNPWAFSQTHANVVFICRCWNDPNKICHILILIYLYQQKTDSGKFFPKISNMKSPWIRFWKLFSWGYGNYCPCGCTTLLGTKCSPLMPLWEEGPLSQKSSSIITNSDDVAMSLWLLDNHWDG